MRTGYIKAGRGESKVLHITLYFFSLWTTWIKKSLIYLVKQNLSERANN